MPTLSAPAAFNPIDLTVFTLGAREGTLSWQTLPGVRLLVRLAEILTGLKFSRPLGNPRLEALRTAAAKLRRGNSLAPGEEAALATLGLTPVDAKALLTRIVASSSR